MDDGSPLKPAAGASLVLGTEGGQSRVEGPARETGRQVRVAFDMKGAAVLTARSRTLWTGANRMTQAAPGRNPAVCAVLCRAVPPFCSGPLQAKRSSITSRE